MKDLSVLDSDVAAILNYSNAASSAIDWDLVFVRKTFAVYPKLIVATNSTRKLSTAVSSCALVRFKVNKETRHQLAVLGSPCFYDHVYFFTNSFVNRSYVGMCCVLI